VYGGTYGAGVLGTGAGVLGTGGDDPSVRINCWFSTVGLKYL